jgi:hypothetical protein
MLVDDRGAVGIRLNRRRRPWRFAADRPPSADLVQTKGLGSQISPAAGENGGMSAQTGTRREKSGIIFTAGMPASVSAWLMYIKVRDRSIVV